MRGVLTEGASCHLLPPFTVYIKHDLFKQSSVWGHLGSFQFFDVVDFMHYTFGGGTFCYGKLQTYTKINDNFMNV